MRGRMIALTTAVIVVVGGWTGAWFWLRDRVETEMDRGLADLAAQGVSATCPERSVTGWPFRLEVTCEKPSIVLPDGSTATAARFAAIGVVDDVRLVRLAVEAPVRVTAADGSQIDVGFESLVASVRHDFATLKRLSIAAVRLDAAARGGGADAGLTAEGAEFHLRPVEDQPENIDVALSLTGAVPSRQGQGTLPAPADLAVVAVLRQAALMAGGPDGLATWSAAGGDIGLSRAALKIGDTRLEASGVGRVTTEGIPEADITAKAEKMEWLTDQAKAGKPLPPILATLGSAVILLGRKEGDIRVVEVKAANGGVTANGLPLPVQVPRLF